MNERVDPFALLKEPTNFTTKPKKAAPVETATIDRVAEQNNFPSRQAPKTQKEPRRQPRRYRTGRNQQLNIKATAETIERFLKTADERKVPLGETLKQLLDAWDRAGATRDS